MTKDKALMIVRNPQAYPADKVRGAAVWLLGCLDLSYLDFIDVNVALGSLTQRLPQPTRRRA